VVRSLLLACLLLLSACSLKQREEQAQIKRLFEKGLYDKALSVLEKSSLKKEDENKLLYLLQKAKLQYAQQYYFEAAANFLKAQDKMDKLYTKKVRELLLSGILSDNENSYRGQIYERSLLFYYQALCHLKIYHNGKYKRIKTRLNDKKEKETYEEVQVLTGSQKRQELFKARAAVLAWDTFYKEIQRSKSKSVFKHDIFAKILAAEIHQLMNKKSDGQIALQLYKDALKILERFGPSLEVYNQLSEKYHEKLWDENKVDKKFLSETDQYKEIKSFIIDNILILTKKYRSYEFNKLSRKYKVKKNEILLKLKNNKKIIIESRTIAPLVGEDFSYNLRSAINEVESPTARAFIQGVGVPILTYFAMGPLGLGAVSTTGNTRVFVRHNVGEVMTQEAGIEFEMPVIKKNKKFKYNQLLVFKNTKDLVLDEKNALIKRPLNLIGPISDMAYTTNTETISNSFTKRGSRIAIKHVIAIIAAYKTYQSIQESSGELLAKPAAFAQYLASSKAIKESEKADTRQWSTLPSEIHISDLKLENGEYILAIGTESAVKNSTGTTQVDKSPIKKLGELNITNQTEELFSFILK